MVNKALLSPCGLYCGVCGVYLAHRDGNDKLKERLAGFYGCKAEDLPCTGCRTDLRPVFCQTCHIRDCVEAKGYEGCYQCGDWPCDFIQSFPVPVGKKVIMRAIPAWRELGAEAWVAAEEARYHCPECGEPQFRGARRCRQCKAELDLD